MEKAKSYGKKTAALLGILVVAIALWYVTFRILSSSNAVKSYQLPQAVPESAGLDKSTLTVGAFNIAHARGGELGTSNWQGESKEAMLLHLDAIASQIRDAQLDVIVLNEVDFSAAWSFHVNQAAYIAEQAGYPYVVEQRNMDVSFPFYKFRFGNAILSRHPIIDSNYLAFPPYSKREAVFAGNHDGMLSILETPLGQIGVAAIHLEFRSEAIRLQAANQLIALADDAPFPIVAAGDFNSTPINFTGARKTATGLNALSCLLGQGRFQAPASLEDNAQSFTFPSQQAAKVIDWVLEKGPLEFIDWRVVRSDLSDHFMVVATLKVSDDEGQANSSVPSGGFSASQLCD